MAMARLMLKGTVKQATLSALAALYGRSHKVISAEIGKEPYYVSRYLSGDRRKEIPDDVYEEILQGIGPIPDAAEPLVRACVEALRALEDEASDLTPEERAAIEMEILAIARRLREGFGRFLVNAKEFPAEGYPSRWDLAPARRWAEVLFARLQAEAIEARPAVIRASEPFQTWALCERVCAASEEAASRDLDTAAAWARLAADIAERVRGPEGFRTRLRGYAAAHGANIVRVAGDLNAADTAFTEAERLWLAGSDPNAVLDPGRILDLKASLRRAQRRLDESLALLQEARTVGRFPERILVKKGFTLEVMGDYSGATEALLEALPLVERTGDPRLLYMAKGNLAVVYTHLGYFDAAAALLPQIRELATERGDGNELPRVRWLEGRILAGLRRPREACRLLAEARQEFQRRRMLYDAALALLEEAALLLEEGRSAEVQPLACELAAVFKGNGVHREALAALRLFHEAVERAEATVEQTRQILRFLFRARHDRTLRFGS
ncbi:MAG TPA: hypothetical protein VGX68_29040 [Thermoanaerobaculia bacterium]|jgi:tetratricopeptide (TPR) repeat protein|nr:hypothetical protein [Thermoanaerobaculia bacterium]